MRKLTFSLLTALLLWASPGWAAWTLSVEEVARHGHYLLTWKVTCTSDGSSMAATDLVALMPDTLKRLAQGSSLLIMKVSPGLTTVAPDTTINVTLSDEQGTAIFAKTGYSNTADTTGISLAADYNQYPPIHGKLYLTLNDIGTAGDQVTLYFECWIEDKV